MTSGRRVRGLALLAGVSLCAAFAMAQPAGGEPAGADEARAWLARIHGAANARNYRGTMVLSAGGQMSSTKVWHVCVGDQTFERLESLDGQQQQVVRHNAEVHTLWPQARIAVVERRQSPAGWPVLPQSVEARLLDQYQLRREPASRVAGRETDVFLLEPRDRLRYAQRLFTDRVTGLMLRADVIGPGEGRPVIESSAFSEVEIGIPAQPRAVLQPAADLKGWQVLRPQTQRTQLEDEGWVVARPVPGFQLGGCVKRQIDTLPGRSSASMPPGPVLQAMFSDGLAHVSLFVEPFDPRRHRAEVQARQGATGTVALRRQEYWFTAVGDAPVDTLRRLIDALERKR